MSFHEEYVPSPPKPRQPEITQVVKAAKVDKVGTPMDKAGTPMIALYLNGSRLHVKYMRGNEERWTAPEQGLALAWVEDNDSLTHYFLFKLGTLPCFVLYTLHLTYL
ncbi:MAG: hypothetical protein LC687_03000 [Actinobacteria bacterium]|nr:hypothetical protein [Actinomycetota bacterium]